MRRTLLLSGSVSFLMAFLGGICAFSLVVPSMVEAQQDRLRVEALTVTDVNNADRVALGTGPGVKSQVAVLDAQGTVRAEMYTGGTNGSDPTSSAIRIPGVARLGTGTSDFAAFDMDDTTGSSRISLDVATDGAPAMTLRDEQEADRVRLSQGPGVRAGVDVLDGAGVPRITMATGGTNPATAGTVPGSSALEIRAGDGAMRARLGTASSSEPEGQVELALRDQDNKVRALLVVSPDGTPSLQFLDASGNVTWSAQ